MSPLPVAWRRVAFGAVSLASLAGLSIAAAQAQDAADEMQRAKAALSAALRDRVAAEQKRAETPPVAAPSPAAPSEARPAAPARAAVAEAEPAPATPPRHRPELRERHPRKALSRVVSRKAARSQTRLARHRSRVRVARAEAVAERRVAAPNPELPSAAGATTPDYPATTGSLAAATPAGAAGAPRPASFALPASLAPTSPTLGSTEPTVYREGVGWIRGTQAALNALQQPLTGVRGARPEVVAACRDAIVPAAVAGGASEVYAAGTARGRSGRNGTVAPLDVRIIYKGVSAYEVRQASVTCELDREGQVVALSDAVAQPGLR
jgi:hypothetical protein